MSADSPEIFPTDESLLLALQSGHIFGKEDVDESYQRDQPG
jgi:hypothetical protein